MRPVFEHGLVDALRLTQMVAPVSRDAREQDLVMAALHHIDGVDLHVAEMLDRGARRLGPVAERRCLVEPLGAQPDALWRGPSVSGSACRASISRIFIPVSTPRWVFDKIWRGGIDKKTPRLSAFHPGSGAWLAALCTSRVRAATWFVAHFAGVAPHSGAMGTVGKGSRPHPVRLSPRLSGVAFHPTA